MGDFESSWLYRGETIAVRPSRTHNGRTCYALYRSADARKLAIRIFYDVDKANFIARHVEEHHGGTLARNALNAARAAWAVAWKQYRAGARLPTVRVPPAEGGDDKAGRGELPAPAANPRSVQYEGKTYEVRLPLRVRRTLKLRWCIEADETGDRGHIQAGEQYIAVRYCLRHAVTHQLVKEVTESESRHAV